MSSQNLRRDAGSIPDVGSSRNSTPGSCRIAQARASRWRAPVGSSRACTCLNRSSSNRARARSMADPSGSRDKPYTEPKKTKFSCEVRSSYSENFCDIYPTDCLSRALSRGSTSPSTRHVPDVGARMPMSTLIVVVLPAPLGPRKPNTSPCSMWNEMWSTAVKLPMRSLPVPWENRRTRSRTSMAGVPNAGLFDRGRGDQLRTPNC